jgi:hypothetical protein
MTIMGKAMIHQGVEFSGRSFSSEEIKLIREVTQDFPSLSLTELSKTLCELLEWKRPNGKLKYEECGALLEHLQVAGMVSLPKLRPTAAPGPREILATAQTDPQTPITRSAGQFEPLSLQLVQPPNRELSSTFNQLIDRWHYLAYRIPFGAHLRYLVASHQLPGRWLACLLFSSLAWKMAPRDAWIPRPFLFPFGLWILPAGKLWENLGQKVKRHRRFLNRLLLSKLALSDQTSQPGSDRP